MRASKNEAGFALILAILALMLLTFLGLTLVTTTSTELQIATNYRWSQQALYNAEAGVEAAKSLLQGYDWVASMPAARAATWNGSTPPTQAGGTPPAVAPQARNDEWGNATRNFENWECDTRANGMGYGVVLDDGGPAGPHQYRTTLLGNNLMGSTTLWVRRPTWHNLDGTLTDFSDTIDATDGDSVVILTAEGIAPYTGGVATLATSAANRAVQVVEVVLRKQPLVVLGPCGNRAGQAGAGAEGAGFSGCDPITGAGVASGLPAGTVTGGGADNTSVK
jgi:type IV pilus assembly PilX-like protein